MEFKAFEAGIEVKGESIKCIIDGMGVFKSLANKYLFASGFGKQDGKGGIVIDYGKDYPLDSFLAAFEKISTEVGDSVLFKIGKSIPNSSQFPPDINSIEDAVQLLDVAYHMNHIKNGKPMFDPDTGKKDEGIGSYGYEKVDGNNMILCEANNPYPCAFDRGLIYGMAYQFERAVCVDHYDRKPCRKKGADTCTYVVTW